MSPWTAEDLRLITDTDDLFVSPFREDGTTNGTPTRVWALVVDDQVYARAAHGVQSSWYQAAVTQRAGRVRVADQDFDVTFAPADAVAHAPSTPPTRRSTPAAPPWPPCRTTDPPPPP